MTSPYGISLSNYRRSTMDELVKYGEWLPAIKEVRNALQDKRVRKINVSTAKLLLEYIEHLRGIISFKNQELRKAGLLK